MIKLTSTSVSIDLGDFQTLEIITKNLSNKNTELAKQNSLFSEVKSFFSDEKRITFYHLGLYKLFLAFSNGGKLKSNDILGIISHLKINDLSKFYLEGFLGNSNKIKLVIFNNMLSNMLNIGEKYYDLFKTLYLFAINNTGDGKLSNNELLLAKENYKKFLDIIEKVDTDLKKINLDSIELNVLELTEKIVVSRSRVEDEIDGILAGIDDVVLEGDSNYELDNSNSELLKVLKNRIDLKTKGNKTLGIKPVKDIKPRATKKNSVEIVQGDKGDHIKHSMMIKMNIPLKKAEINAGFKEYILNNYQDTIFVLELIEELKEHDENIILEFLTEYKKITSIKVITNILRNNFNIGLDIKDDFTQEEIIEGKEPELEIYEEKEPELEIYEEEEIAEEEELEKLDEITLEKQEVQAVIVEEIVEIAEEKIAVIVEEIVEIVEEIVEVVEIIKEESINNFDNSKILSQIKEISDLKVLKMYFSELEFIDNQTIIIFTEQLAKLGGYEEIKILRSVFPTKISVEFYNKMIVESLLNARFDDKMKGFLIKNSELVNV